MRLYDLKGEADRDGRIECISALFENPHARSGTQPMSGRNDTERARDLRPGCERCFADIRTIAQSEVTKLEICRHLLTPCGSSSILNESIRRRDK
jgi:hypothetical protein